MSRRNKSILEDLATLPWWINVILAGIIYLLLKYLIPAIPLQNPFYHRLAMQAPSLAPLFVAVLLFVAAISAFNAWRKGELLERQKDIGTLRLIGWQEFEELVGEAYRRKGYAVTETGGGGADGGVDLILRKNGESLLVQCKHWRIDKVGVKIIRELYGVVAAEGATGGIVISSGTFTQEARNFAGGKPLQLIDGKDLLAMISEVRKKPQPVQNPAHDNLCPLCGSAMVLRTAKKGPHAGEQFWGCSSFPKCRGTKPYNSLSNQSDQNN